MCDVAARRAIARDDGNDGRSDGDPAEHEHGKERNRPEHRSADDDDAEDDGFHGGDDAEDAAHPPAAILTGERAREQRDAHGLADAHGGEAVDERADPVARRSIQAREPAAAEAERRAPARGRGKQAREKAEGREPEPARTRVLEARDRIADPVAEEVRHGRDHCRSRSEQGGSEEDATGKVSPQVEIHVHKALTFIGRIRLAFTNV